MTSPRAKWSRTAGKMAKGPTHIFVLVEDIVQQNLVRHYLNRAGLATSCRFEPLPNGAGCGEQYVRKRFPEIVKKVQSSLGRAVAAIAVIMIDADLETVAARRAQLINSQQNTQDSVILIPKRHVETWVGALLGNAVDELVDYKRQFGNATMVKQAALELFNCARPNAQLPPAIPQSLVTSIPELQKIR